MVPGLLAVDGPLHQHFALRGAGAAAGGRLSGTHRRLHPAGLRAGTCACFFRGAASGSSHEFMSVLPQLSYKIDQMESLFNIPPLKEGKTDLAETICRSALRMCGFLMKRTKSSTASPSLSHRGASLLWWENPAVGNRPLPSCWSTFTM